MSEFSKDFVKDIAQRTKNNLEAYKGEYEITLLINCMLALVSLPTGKTCSEYKGRIFRKCIVNKMMHMNVIVSSTNENKTFRAVKNALSHMNIEIKNVGGKVSEILFLDKHPDSNHYHTILKFNTQQLREFALFVANKHLERLSNVKTK